MKVAEIRHMNFHQGVRSASVTVATQSYTKNAQRWKVCTTRKLWQTRKSRGSKAVTGICLYRTVGGRATLRLWDNDRTDFVSGKYTKHVLGPSSSYCGRRKNCLEQAKIAPA